MDAMPPTVTTLTDSLDPLRNVFNRTGRDIRFLALLSPT